ncbi:MAG: helix-turn-helix transcriptional regulator [Muricomes sp.]
MYERHLSTRQVSKMTGVSKSSIQEIMNEYKSPTMNTMEKLAAGLKVNIESLYESDYK